jgi:thiosulfate/3-mercaptopyruvate sulfurtransferase
MPRFGAEEAGDLARDGVLLDARIRRNYLGVEPEGHGPRKGHIPGARSAPAHDALTDEGEFAPAETLAEHFRGLGAVPGTPVGVYCGAGMSAAHSVLALASIGIEASMYPGSWSAWVSDPSRPVAKGHAPGG